MSLSLVSKTFSIDESDIDIKKFIQIANKECMKQNALRQAKSPVNSHSSYKLE